MEVKREDWSDLNERSFESKPGKSFFVRSSLFYNAGDDDNYYHGTERIVFTLFGLLNQDFLNKVI